jgi:hypothetical protein
MSICRGGSHDGEPYSGHSLALRTVVLPKRGPDGRDIPGSFELYQRDEPGGTWIYRRDGSNDTGEPWSFERSVSEAAR